MGDWPVGLSTGCFYEIDIQDCLEPIQHAGFGMIEVCSFPAHLDYHDRARVVRARDRIRELNLEPYSFHAPFAEHIDLSSLDPRRQEQAVQETLAAAEAAAVLGCRYFVIHPGPETGFASDHEYLPRMQQVVRALDTLGRRCRELGTRLVLENKLPHLFAGSVRDLMWILGALEEESVGVCLDTGHAYLSGTLETVAHKLSGHLWMLHASDNRGKYDDHLPPGEGAIDWEGLIRQLVRSRFRGAMIMEIARTGTVEETLARAQQGRNFLRNASCQVTRVA